MVEDVLEVPHNGMPNVELNELSGGREVPTGGEVVGNPNLGASHLVDWCWRRWDRWSIGFEVQTFKRRRQVGLGDSYRGGGFRVQGLRVRGASLSK